MISWRLFVSTKGRVSATYKKLIEKSRECHNHKQQPTICNFIQNFRKKSVISVLVCMTNGLQTHQKHPDFLEENAVLLTSLV